MSEEEQQQGKAIDLGYRIGQKREQMGLSIDDIAETIHLRRAHIRAIEAGAFHELPGEAYVRGYLKRYVDFLDLDSEQMLGEYTEATAVDSSKRLLGLPEIFSEDTHASGQLAIMGVVLSTLFVTLWNMANPVIKVPLVLPYAQLENTPKTTLPHRCDDAAVYPPCGWEDTDLWYRPSKTHQHVFAPHHDQAP